MFSFKYFEQTLSICGKHIINLFKPVKPPLAGFALVLCRCDVSALQVGALEVASCPQATWVFSKVEMQTQH